MRLREIESNLTKAKDLLDSFSASQLKDYSPARFQINSLNNVREAISILLSLNLFQSDTELLRLSSVSNNIMDSIHVSAEEYNNIRSIISRIQVNCTNLLDSLQVALPQNKMPEYTVFIKLPEVKDFDDLAQLMDKLKKAIQIPVLLDGINGEVLIENFDSGSKWLEVIVKSTIAVNLIGSLVWSGAVIYKKIQESIIVEEHARRVKLGNEHLEALITANETQVMQQIEIEALYIQREFFENEKPENLERLKLSIKTMAELIEKGTQIHPAVLAPENASNLYPDYSKLMLIESKQKLLENK